jgi:hypothetical protein
MHPAVTGWFAFSANGRASRYPACAVDGTRLSSDDRYRRTSAIAARFRGVCRSWQIGRAAGAFENLIGLS